MKPAAIATLVISTSLLSFAMGRFSAKTACCAKRSAPVAAMAPAAPALPSATAPTRAPALVGRVLEVIQVPGYTYLRFEMPGGDRWAAVSATTKVAVGDTVKLGDAMVMHGFASPTLKRTFDTIYFAQLL